MGSVPVWEGSLNSANFRWTLSVKDDNSSKPEVVFIVANIWFVQEGVPAKGYPVAERPFQWCLDELQLRPFDWLISLEQRWVVGDKSNLSVFTNSRYVFVELREEDISDLSVKGWKPGYYIVHVSVEEAKRRLNQPTKQTNKQTNKEEHYLSLGFRKSRVMVPWIARIFSTVSLEFGFLGSFSL